MARFRQDRSGGVLVLFALMMPVLMGLSAAAIEYASLVKRRAELQRSADTASIAGVNQFKLANADDVAAIRTAEAMARAQARSPNPGTMLIKAQVVGTHSGVQVTISEEVPLSLGKLINMPSVAVSVQSTAKLAGTTRLCLLALDALSIGAFHLESAARITASDCSLYSNSLHPAGIQGENAAVASALSICSAGGYAGSGANFTPPPATGCPPLRDPLADRQGPTPESCINLLGMLLNPKKLIDGLDNLLYGAVVVSGNVTLRPGTYCGGLHITKGARVTLEPGVYIMKDGPLVVDKHASLTGVNTGFYFTGVRGGVLFDQKSVISLTAPRDGIMSGLLLFEDRNAPPPLPSLLPLDGKGLAKPAPGGLIAAREYRIISDNARTLLGTIYLPVGRLIIDSSKPVADQSDYTVIVARMITLYDGPNLILNARYSSTDIPVPKGVGPSSGDTQLTQ
ncbi:TadE/TadG family type IV pilus assembly protein [Methylobacterium sp. J-068]|uniref:TadE/TadG family type IV pilus assembly protein n=1 Tax=Methylobacterium sp. J-068 TaxID=2836649 RepID=UPI001FBAAAA0|nr:TadE/TadG family type IV pilus assembly protein [Methylobacterium sp. J-068]MCJ2035791.1 pilus assembly protein [Methylobacterium sp. J-068]